SGSRRSRRWPSWSARRAEGRPRAGPRLAGGPAGGGQLDRRPPRRRVDRHGGPVAVAEDAAAVVDGGGEHLAQHAVGVGDAGLGHPDDRLAQRVGGGVAAEALEAGADLAGEAAGPPLGVRRLGERPPAPGAQRPRGPALEVVAHALGGQDRHGEHPLPLGGDDRQRRRRGPEGDLHVDGGVVAVQPDHRRDEGRELAAPGVGGVVVDQPGERGEQGVRAGRVVAPPLTGQERGQLHEAGALPRVAVLAAGQLGDQLGHGAVVSGHEAPPGSSGLSPPSLRPVRRPGHPLSPGGTGGPAAEGPAVVLLAGGPQAVEELRRAGVRRGAPVALAVDAAAGVGMAAAGRRLAVPAADADPASVVDEVERVLRPRWVWWDAGTAVRLVAAGVRVATCWDLAAVDRLLHGGWRGDPAAVWAGARRRARAAAPDGAPDLGSVAADLDEDGGGDGAAGGPVRRDGHLKAAWVDGGWAAAPGRLAAWAAAALAAAERQQERLRQLDRPVAAAVARSESTAELLCAE